MTGTTFRLPALLCAALMVCLGVSGEITFSRLDIAMTLNADGSADFKELWEITHDGKSSTEFYFSRVLKPPYSLADFSVSENGVDFKRVDPWVVEASLQEKNHCFGIRQSGYDYEFCWGLGATGTHQFIIKYTINNIIRQCSDNSALLYHTFYNAFKPMPKHTVVHISRAGTPLSESDIVDMKSNNIVDLTFANGVIQLEPNEPFDVNDHMSIRAEFNRNAFDSIYNAGASSAVTPEELSSPMMTITRTADAAGSWSDRIWDFYDSWPNVTLLLLIGGLFGLFYLIKKIWIALI